MRAQKELSKKRQALLDRLRGLGSLIVAFSGGVDSTFLLAVAQEALGDKVLAVTARSAFFPENEIEEARTFAGLQGIDHLLLESEISSVPQVAANPPERCYFCKRELFARLREIAEKRGIRHIAHGANMDDLSDYRPGWKAAEEMGILAPLVEARLTKEEIRFLAKEMGLSAWDKPSMACLASRIPYGEPITETTLRMIGEAEKEIASHGFTQYRVRAHGPLARIEVEPSEMNRILEPETRKKISAKLKEIGFLYVSLDLEGYVTGSLNKALKK